MIAAKSHQNEKTITRTRNREYVFVNGNSVRPNGVRMLNAESSFAYVSLLYIIVVVLIC